MSTGTEICIGGHRVGPTHPVYIIAELSANHNGSLDAALEIVRAAARCGADAIKLQTYTADTMTIDSRDELFMIGKGTLWEGRNLYQLYEEAFTPWEWHKPLMDEAKRLGLDFFSTPFDFSAVDYLEELQVPVYKIASFEIVDLPLIRRVAETGKPIIMSTGMASLAEIDEAVRAARDGGCEQLALLKCTSAYPALPEEMDLRTIPHLAAAFGVVTGLSDHTLGPAVPVASVALGASIIEKHFTLSRDEPGPDSAFSLEPSEFRAMIEAVRVTEQALGRVCYEVTAKEESSRVFRRSLFVVKNVRRGEEFTPENVRSIRPGHGLAPKYIEQVWGRHASRDIERGTPVTWSLIS